LFSEYKEIPWQVRRPIYLSFIPNVAIGYAVGISLFWILFKGNRLPEEMPKEAQVPAQSSSFEGPEVER
jgi:hypothetical protein